MLKDKSIELFDWQEAVRVAFSQAVDGKFWAMAIYDDHVIASPDDPVELAAPLQGRQMYRVGYTGITSTAGDGQTEFVKNVEFAPRDEWIPVIPTFASIMLTEAKEADGGRRRWLGVSSGGFEDREGELVSTSFLTDALARAEKSGERGDLRIWHIPGSRVGACDFQAMHGGFLLESGLMDDTPAGANATKWMEANDDPRLSIKFMYKNRSPDGVYSPPGMIVERSILPSDVAAFPWAGITLKEFTMTAQISDEKRQVLSEIIGDDEADQVLSNLEDGSAQLKEANVRFKEIGGDEPDAETETEAEAETPDTEIEAETETIPETETKEADPPSPLADDLVEFDFELNEKAIAAIAGDVAALLKPIIDPLVAEIHALRTATKEMGADLAIVVEAEDQRLAEKAALLPRATVKLVRDRPTKTKEASEPAIESQPTSLLEQGLTTLYGED